MDLRLACPRSSVASYLTYVDGKEKVNMTRMVDEETNK